MVISGNISNIVTNRRLQFRKLGTKMGIFPPTWLKLLLIGNNDSKTLLNQWKPMETFRVDRTSIRNFSYSSVRFKIYWKYKPSMAINVCSLSNQISVCICMCLPVYKKTISLLEPKIYLYIKINAQVKKK